MFQFRKHNFLVVGGVERLQGVQRPRDMNASMLAVPDGTEKWQEMERQQFKLDGDRAVRELVGGFGRGEN